MGALHLPTAIQDIIRRGVPLRLCPPPWLSSRHVHALSRILLRGLATNPLRACTLHCSIRVPTYFPPRRSGWTKSNRATFRPKLFGPSAAELGPNDVADFDRT